VIAPSARPPGSFVALAPMDLTLRRGESIGIVGRNGSGKSTLLSVIAGVLVPTTGRVELRGRVAALLELGSGFDPEFTGRENAYFNGALHGLTRAEMDERIDRIEAFAEIGDFVDRPVKTYSSGMFVRMAFAVAAHLDPDILIVDESLSVGDVFFQQKCFERLRAMRERGTSLLFVSHDGNAVQRFCDRAILLDHGRVVMEDVPRVVIGAYETHALHAEESAARDRNAAPPATLDGEHRIVAREELTDWNATLLVGGNPANVTTGSQPFTLRISVTPARRYDDPHLGFKLRDGMGVVVYESNTYCLGIPVGPVAAGETLTVDFTIATPLAPGDYTFTVGGADGGYGAGSFRHHYIYYPDAVSLRVLAATSGTVWAGIVDLQPAVNVMRKQASPAP
jgi:lipopolysaccharide transport system ATP-binding protein